VITRVASPEADIHPVIDAPAGKLLVHPSRAPAPAPPADRIETAPAAATPKPLKAHELVAELAELSGLPGPITPEQAQKFKAILDELVHQGAAAVPAIQEFLRKNIEYDYSEISGGDQLSYSSFRHSLLDALKQVGGPDAQVVMLETLQTTAAPSELLELATDLEQEAPGQYREQVLNAARESLEMAATNPAASNLELAPAFRMLQNYGAASTVEDAAKTDPANFYNAIALANLPDGQGLPALIQMAQNASPDPSGQTIATEMIAQLAGQNLQAVETLLQMAQQGQIRNSVWEKLAPILGGDQYQIGGSAESRNYAIVNGALSPEEIARRIALIDTFLGFVPGDSAAAAALQHQRGVLNEKLGS
jgi:hypothetical protein